MNSKRAFEKAVKNFPRWMDIRKRKNKSSGGLYLKAVIDEVDGIAAAIEDYRKSFFAYNYIGKEEAVVAYLKVANVGNIEAIELIAPEMPVTTDIKLFNESAYPMACLHDGSLLIKPEHHLADSATYKLGNYTYDAALTTVHIWNVFDEFALYSGISRHEGESNKSLLNRSMLMFRNITNSTSWGLENAILNELSSIAEITPGEIVIEKLNDDNVFLTNKDDEPIYEEISRVDADTYRNKKWDKNLWDHEFKELEYAPHKWDENISFKQSGTGHGDSLKAQLLSELGDKEATDVEIDIYEMSDVRVEEYVRNNRTEAEIELEFIKYSNVLKTQEVEFRVVAEDTVDIKNEDISIESYRVMEGEIEYDIDSIVLESEQTAQAKVTGGKVSKGKRYSLRFYPQESYSKMSIEKCMLEDGKSSVNLLKERSGYAFVDGALHNTLVKFNGNKMKDFRRHDNIMDAKGGFTLKDASNKAWAEIDVSNIKNQYLKIGHTCRESSIITSKEMIGHKNFSLKEGKLVSNGIDGQIIIELEASTFSLEMEQGNGSVSIFIDGEHHSTEVWFDKQSLALAYDTPKNIKVEIMKMHTDQQMVISSIKYSHYLIETSLSQGNFINTSMGRIVPSSKVPTYLTLTIQTFSGFSPIIEYVHIGSSLREAVYATEEFVPKQDGTLSISTSCKVELVEHQETGELVTQNYSTDSYYTNTSRSPIFIPVNLDEFSHIKESTPAIEKIQYQGRTENWIKIMPGQKLTTIKIDGSVTQLLERKKLPQVIATTEGEGIFPSKRLKGFVINGKDERLVRIDRSQLHASADKFKVIGANNLTTVFVIDSMKSVELIGNECSGFEYLYMFKDSRKEYVAYNTQALFKKEVNGLNIVDVFYPALPANLPLIYDISQVNTDFKAIVNFDSKRHWSYGIKKVDLSLDLSEGLEGNYDYERKVVNHKFTLSNSIELDREIEVNEGLLDIAQYILKTTDGIDVTYRTEESAPEHYYIEEDGFTKLYYSNIDTITMIRFEDGSSAAEKDFDILHDEGIISWKSDEHIGKQVEVRYKHKVASYLEFVDTSKLYDLAGYDLEALKKSYSIAYYGIKDAVDLNKDEVTAINSATKIVVSSSNPRIKATINNGAIELETIYTDDHVAVHSGFYYEDGKEYYYFANKNETEQEKEEIILYNGTRQMNDEIIFSQASTNMIPGTNMKGDYMRTVSRADLEMDGMLEGVSSLNAITASDMYNNWSLFEADIELAKGHNGNGTKISKFSKEGYAVLEVTDSFKEDMILSFYFSGRNVSLAREVVHGKNRFNKSVFASKEYSFRRSGDFYYINAPTEAIKNGDRLFLLIEDEGIIDDIVCHSKDINIERAHKKNIDLLNIAIEEIVMSGYVRPLLFDKAFAYLSQAEIDHEGQLRTSTTISWGYTKIKDYRRDIPEFLLTNVQLVKDSYIKSGDRLGTVETSPIYVRGASSVNSLHIKINEILKEDMEGLNVKVFMSDTLEGTYRLVASENGVNSVSVPGTRMDSYVKLLIEMPPRKILTNIEVYAEYSETAKKLSVTSNGTGEFVSKIYDSGFEENYLVKSISFLKGSSHDNAVFSIRGMRQNNNDSVWTEWKDIIIDADGNIKNSVKFEGYQYFQYRIELLSEQAKIELESVDLEVIDYD